MLWIENSGFLIKPDAEQTQGPEDGTQSVNQEAMKAAIDRWHGSRVHPGQGNDRFFAFAVELRSAGMDLHQIETTLRSEAAYGRSPSERRAQIPGIMNTLRQRR